MQRHLNMSKNIFRYLIVILMTYLPISCGFQALPVCNETADKLQLCSIRPNYDLSKTTETEENQLILHSSVTLFTVSDFNEDDGSVTISVLLSAWWNDTRLSLHKPMSDQSPLDWYDLTDADSQKIFNPLMRFLNVKQIEKSEKFGPVNDDFYWFRMPHKIEFQKAFKVSIYCSFDFKFFPFDSHQCDFSFGTIQASIIRLLMMPSWIRDDDRAIVKDGESALLAKQSRQPFDIYLESLTPFTQNHLGYDYPHTGMRLYFKRNTLGLLFGGLYVPTGIFAILSLISFSINIDSVPGRLGLLITLYLIASNTYNSIDAPDGRGFSFLEVWMLGVQIPILLAVFEYFIILTMKRRGSKSTKIKHFMVAEDEENEALEIQVKLIDKWTFYGSIAFMVIFNVAYWTIAYLAI